jgi:hypothetical protein
MPGSLMNWALTICIPDFIFICEFIINILIDKLRLPNYTINHKLLIIT